MFSSLIFTKYHLWELFKKGWLEVDKSKIFHAYSDAMGSLFRLWLRLWHVMLDVIFILCLVVIDVAWLVSNNWECLMCHWKKSCVVFIIPKHNLWYSPLNVSFGLTWRMLTPCYCWNFGPIWTSPFDIPEIPNKSKGPLGPVMQVKGWDKTLVPHC